MRISEMENLFTFLVAVFGYLKHRKIAPAGKPSIDIEQLLYSIWESDFISMKYVPAVNEYNIDIRFKEQADKDIFYDFIIEEMFDQPVRWLRVFASSKDSPWRRSSYIRFRLETDRLLPILMDFRNNEGVIAGRLEKIEYDEDDIVFCDEVAYLRADLAGIVFSYDAEIHNIITGDTKIIREEELMSLQEVVQGLNNKEEKKTRVLRFIRYPAHIH